MGLSVGSLLLGAIAILATTDLAQRKNVALAALLAGLAVLILLLAVWLWRRSLDPQAKFLELAVDLPEVSRGDRITATVVVVDAARVAGTVQVGLVCSEFFDKKVQTVDSNGNSYTTRSTQREEAVAEWHDVPDGAPQSSVSFTLPVDAPFSYEGDTVSWAWRVTARVQRPHRSDPHRNIAIWVSP